MTNERRIFRGSPQYYERVREISLGESELDFLSLNMPPVCNYRCHFCLSGMNGRQKPQNSLTGGELQDLIIEARNLGALHIEVSGEGEPLVYRRMLEEIINFASPRGLHTTIFTNGSLLTEDFLHYLAQNDASLAVSLDYLDRGRYEHFAGRTNSYDTVIGNIELARNIFRRSISKENGYRVLPLAIHNIVTADNRDEIPRIREFAGDEFFFSVAPIMNRGNTREHSDLLTDSRQTDSIINQYSDGSLIVSDSSVRDVGRPTCGTFFYGIGIRYDGEILFDAHAYDTAGLFGNIRNHPLPDLVIRLRDAQRTYFERFSDEGFCPLRNQNFDSFVQYLRQKDG